MVVLWSRITSCPGLFVRFSPSINILKEQIYCHLFQLLAQEAIKAFEQIVWIYYIGH